MFKKQTVPFVDTGEMVASWPTFKRAKYIHYPWDLWTNGRIWKIHLTQLNNTSFKSVLVNYAKNNQLKLKIKSNRQTIWFQFRKKGINDD